VADNPTIRHLAAALRPPSGGWPVSGRPIFNFSLALNYAVSGEATWSYHVFSVAIHVAAALVLLAAVGRTLLGLGYSPLRAAAVGWASALLWSLHPLQTESVTYISQRSEELSGLFYLLTLYAFIRGWRFASIAACLLGMATKEVMVTAPVMVLLYDRVFVARSWKAVLRRKVYYMGLAATWIVLAALMAGSGSRGGTAGFGTSIAWWAYALTQFRAVARYLALCFWPRPLLFSYGLTLGGPPLGVAVDAAIVLALAGTSLLAALRGSRLGFLGAWFFLILSPTSTVVPIATELIAEHRVYLSLAAACVLAAVLADRLLERMAARHGGAARWRGAGVAALVLVAAAEGAATHERNRVYGSVLALWSDTVAKSPDDAGARNNLGNALAEQGRLQEAEAQFREALRLVPAYDDPHFNLAHTLVREGRVAEAIPHYEAALAVRPGDARYRYALGAALRQMGRISEARAQFEAALSGESESPGLWYDLGNAFLGERQLPEAEKAFAAAIRLRPDYLDAIVNHAGVLAELGRAPEAIREFEAALRLEPSAADIHNNLGGLLAESGRLAEARRQFEAALALKPDYREARDNLERVKEMEAAPPR
jgi:tetratricopeptide (TPR) repeat protein